MVRSPPRAASSRVLSNRGSSASTPAARGFVERDLERVLDVLAPLARDRPTPPALEAESGKSTTLAGKVGVEEVAEIAESGRLPGALARLRLVLARELLLSLDPLPIGTKLVVFRSLLWVAQHLVGFVDQLEAISGLRILIDIRVVLPGQAPGGGVDLFLGRGRVDAQGRVVVLVRWSSHLYVSRVMPILSVAQTRRHP